jgi:hypothetical protein
MCPGTREVKVRFMCLLFYSKCPDLMVFTHTFDFKKGPKRSKWGTRRLREFCGSQWCFVMLLGSIATDIPRATLLKIKYLKILKESKKV